MRRFWIACLICLMSLSLLMGCGGKTKKASSAVLIDGEYKAEFAEFDSNGYKDFLRVTVKDGKISSVEYNAMDANGNLKTDDEKFGAKMEKVNGTSPKRFSADLANQLIENGNIEGVDDVAGATWSSNSFRALFNALHENNMQTGDTTVAIVENVPQL